jgi:hypothetical protein
MRHTGRRLIERQLRRTLTDLVRTTESEFLTDLPDEHPGSATDDTVADVGQSAEPATAVPRSLPDVPPPDQPGESL